jgi:hypothetical protein
MNCFQECIFGECAQALIFQHHFKVIFWLLLRSIEILCRFRFRCLANYPFGHPVFSMAFDIFLWHYTLDCASPHPMACGFSWCICNYPIDSTRIHLFHYVHGKNTLLDDVVHKILTSFVGFHVLCEQIHVFRTPFF